MNTHNTTQPETQTVINQVADFYGQYLSCSPEQLDLLALWTLHTHCFHSAPFSPPLNISSRRPQSGKTLCLELLSLLCHRPCFHTSPAPSLLLHQLQGQEGQGCAEDSPFVETLLLDDGRINTQTLGILAASFKSHGQQTVESKDGRGGLEFDLRPAYFPKAFAGNRRLPACLAGISIPIALEPKRPVLRCQPKEPGSPCRRFRRLPAFEQTRDMHNALHWWGKENSDLLGKIAPYEEDQFPPELSSRQQDIAEPLLHIADLIGGQWSQRARQALVNAFALAAFEDFYSSRQILSDLRDAFAAKGNIGWISTADLLAFLHTLDDRAWDEWNKGKPMKPKDLASLLEPFGIHSHNHRTGPDKVIKGYNLEDFQPSWTRHPHQPYGTANPVAQHVAQPPPAVIGSDVAAAQNPSTGISGQQPEASSPHLISSDVAAELAQSAHNEFSSANSMEWRETAS